MEFKKLEEIYGHFYNPEFRIEVARKDLLKQDIGVFGVTVNHSLNGADTFSFTIDNPYDPDGKKFPLVEENTLLEPGNEVEIKMGYVDKKHINSLLTGHIASVTIDFPASGISQITVTGYDYSHQMMKEKKSENWGSGDKHVKYSDIVKKLASDKYKLGVSKIEDTKEEHPQVKQDQESDYEFIKNRIAEKIGFEFFVFGKDLYFRSPASDKDSVVTTLEWGKGLISFTPQINSAAQVSEVRVRGWDSSKQKPIIGKAKAGEEHGRDKQRKSGGEKVKKVVKHFWRPVSSQKKADDLAKAYLNKFAREYVTGKGECTGIPDILPGRRIELKGLGKRFSKGYYIESTTHTMNTSGYKTTFNVKETTL